MPRVAVLVVAGLALSAAVSVVVGEGQKKLPPYVDTRSKVQLLSASALTSSDVRKSGF
jgi:hypothetical protein